MSAYYNEIEPYAAEWLRGLIKQGLIADGEVDERSVVDVRPDDLRGFDQHHFFAGIGGWSLGARLAGWPDDRPLWTGSCPCQPFSAIGKGRGFDDERDLWPAFYGLIRECRPAVVFGEQVASEDALGWLDRVFVDLEASDYAVTAFDLCAAGVGAPHIRQRLYWLGYSVREGLEGHGRDGAGDGRPQEAGSDAEAGSGRLEPASLDAVSMLRGLPLHHSRSSRSRLRMPAIGGMGNRPIWAEFDALACSDGWRRVRSGTFPVAHGVPARVGRLRAYGNAIVPQVAAEVISAFMETKEEA